MNGGRAVSCAWTSEESRRIEGLVANFGSPLLAFDPDVLVRQYHELSAALAGVKLYYAVKANPHEAIVRTIDSLEGGFDVASSGETDLLLGLKVFGRRTIHTHPIKKDDEIRTALRFGVTTFVVDNLYELEKLVSYRSRVGVLLRLSFRSPSAIVDLSKKFGCTLDEAAGIIEKARELGIHVKGVSFHVGSQCDDAEKHVEAITASHQFMQAMNEKFANQGMEAPLNLLDIGGGFPADYRQIGLDIHAFCAPIRKALAELPSDWDVIAEPGRFLIAPAVTSVTTVIGKSIRDEARWYYLDDGVYGSYSGQIYDHACYPLQVVRKQSGAADEELFTSVLAGPTCDSIDIVAENVQLPELEPGDFILGHEMGAYTAATKTRFNSLPDAKFVDLSTMRTS